MYPYPLLQKIKNSYGPVDATMLQNVYVCACQHLLEPQKRMFQMISEFGIPKKNIFVLGKAYSTNIDILTELQTDRFHAIQPPFKIEESFDKQHKENCEAFLEFFMSHIPQGSKAILLDDGGQLLSVANEHYEKLRNFSITGIEQTSSGFNRMKGAELHFPIINVARSSTKLIKESPIIAKLCFERINKTLEQYSITEPRILIVGLGPIGENIFSLFKETDYFTIGHDIKNGNTDEIEDLITANKINIVVGATGSEIMNGSQLMEIENEDVSAEKIYLISVSSSDREFPAVHIRMGSKPSDIIHSDSAYKNIVLVNGGFPVTFKGNRYEANPEKIEKTIALLFGSVLHSIKNSFQENIFVDVPVGIIETIEK